MEFEELKRVRILIVEIDLVRFSFCYISSSIILFKKYSFP